MITVRQTDDLEDVRELNALAFPSDEWIGDEHEFWLARDGDLPIGFCSAVWRPDRGYVFLSRCAVLPTYSGRGLQQRMIHVRVAWARRIGAHRVITYAHKTSFSSIVNLIKAGMRLYTPPTEYAGPDFLYFEKRLCADT